MSAAVVASLALGIAANTAVFSFVNAIQFKPLPVADEATLVDVSETSPAELCAGCAVGTSYPTYADWKGTTSSFAVVGAYREERFVVAGSGGPARVGGALASAELFPMLGVQPAVGRGFSWADDRPGAEPVVILSDLLWTSRLAGDVNVLGRTLKVNGVPRTIIGVMPPGFRFPEFAQLWVPLAPAAAKWTRTDRSLAVVARLRRGVDIERARTEMRAVAAAQAAAYADSHARWTTVVVPLREDMTAETAMASTVLLGAVAFVLLIACANVANLLLARAFERRRELAIRLSLGASRARIVRLVLAESLVLAVAGGIAGLIAALWLAGSIVTALGMQAPYWIQFGIDWRVFAFCAVVTIVAAGLCGAAPAFQASRPDVNAELKDGATSSASPGATRLRHTLIVGQLALALVLLACAGLLIKTVIRTFRFDAGYDASKVVVGDLNLEGPAFDKPGAITTTASAILDRLHRRSGVRAAVSKTVFFRGFGAEPQHMAVEGMPGVPAGASPAFYVAVTDEYFSIVNLRLRDGRAFSRDDRDVAIVNAALAGQVWGARSPIGSRIRLGNAVSPWLTVIGIAEGGGGSPMSGPERPLAYVPFWSQPGREFALYASIDSDAAVLLPEVRSAVAAADPDLPIEDLMTMEQAQARWAAPARFVAALMTSLSSVAVMLASIGIYGVMAFGIGQRAREIGVRLALGATPRQVQTLVARTGARLVATGIVVGTAAAWACTRMLEGILAGTSPTDTTVFASVGTVLALVGCLASWLPARKAARIDPLVVLRQS
jgi:putative ABC transport system permease protein